MEPRNGSGSESKPARKKTLEGKKRRKRNEKKRERAQIKSKAKRNRRERIKRKGKRRVAKVLKRQPTPVAPHFIPLCSTGSERLSTGSRANRFYNVISPF